jgi:predicted permease
LNTLLKLFADNLLPILLVAGAGFIFQRSSRIDPQPLARVIFYTFTPALVFELMDSTEIEAGAILRMVVFGISIVIAIGLLSWLLSRLFRLDSRTASAFILSATFMNAGNYGLSLNNLVLGEVGLAWASIFFVTSAMLSNSAGVYVATVGRSSPARALLGLLKIPAVYAIPIALVVRLCDWNVPQALDCSISILASAAIPSMLLLLGMQISQAGLPKRKGLLAAAASLRLLASPLVAWFIAPLFGLAGISAQAGVLESATPTAVMTIVLATEFDVEPEFVTSVVLVTTLLSPLTITPLLAIMRV